MLVLTRRSGESILIGNDVRVRVLGSTGSRVRLGIEAPIDIRILREKLESPSQPAPALPVLTEPPPRRPPPAVLANRHTTLE